MQLHVQGFRKWWRTLQKVEIVVELYNTEITITRRDNRYLNRNKVIHVPLENITKLNIKSSGFSSELHINYTGTSFLVLKGYNSEQLKQFKAQFIQLLLKLVASSERWKRFQTSLEQRNNHNVYLSSTQWQPIAELHQLITRFSKLGITSEHFTNEIPNEISNETFNEIHRKVFIQAQTLSSADVSELGRKLHNQSVVPRLLAKYKTFFDTIEKLPLTENQRIACVTNDDHNLVIAGAGTGKTATLIGKAGFLVEANIAKAQNVLLLAFGNKAAVEMNERIQERIPTLANSFKASTFHALGNRIIANNHGNKKTVTAFSDKPYLFTQFINTCLEQLAQSDNSYKALLVNYLSSLSTPAKSALNFDNIESYHAFLSSCQLVTLKGEWVKSVGELRIANYLTLNGIDYQYDVNYAPITKDDTKHVAKNITKQTYKPNFFLPSSNVYIEYLSLNEQLETAPFVDQKSYLENIEYKRNLHQTNGTTLIELFAYQLMNGTLQQHLQQALNKHSVTLAPIELNQLFQQFSQQPAQHVKQKSGSNNNNQWQSLVELLKRFLGLYKEGQYTTENLLASLQEQQGQSVDIERTRVFLALFEPVFLSYQEHLNDTNTVDFSDMISTAIKIIESGQFTHTYNHILVDEFQDISGGRAKLLKALLASKPNIRLFAVGDDWQSIYRFNGADISLFTQFNQSFSPSTAVPLDKTFRFNNKIHNVSSQFVMANPEQLNKNITTHTEIEAPAIRLVDIKQELQPSLLPIKEQKQHAYKTVLHRCLNTFNKSAQQQNKRLSLLIIGRYRKEKVQILKDVDLSKLPFAYLNISYVTAHASKGLEADYVILLEVETGNFPSVKENDELIDLVLPQKESYLYAEERRLFYVALTRAKHFVYILFDSDQASPFVTEINQYGNTLVDNKLATSFTQFHCPSCNSGTLKALQTRYNKTFYTCTLTPACNNTVNACKQCNSPMQPHSKGFKHCLGCGEIELNCSRCGVGTMVGRLENDPDRDTFYSCNRYRRGADDSCNESMSAEAFEIRCGEVKNE